MSKNPPEDIPVLA